MNVLRLRPCLAGLLLALSLAAPVRAADNFRWAYISEFLADNQQGLRDDNGDRSGWIELHHGGRQTMTLAGWYLTDDPTNLTKWPFPGVWLMPDKSLVVFASGKNRITDLAHLHTNFLLKKKGGYLALVNPATNIVSEFFLPPQSADISFGTLRDEPEQRGPFARPTPGKPNAVSGTGFAPDVLFSKPGGNFTAPFPVGLSTRPPGPRPVIRYTLDGTLPTTNSPAYAAPLLITNTTQLRARAYLPGLLPGPPNSAAYLQLSTNVLGFTSTLPVLILDTFGRNTLVSTRGMFVQLSLHEPVKGRTSLTSAPTLTTRGGFHIRGSTSASMPQASFALQFLDEFNGEKNLPLLGLPSESDWVLYAPNYFDPVMIHNAFVHQLSRDMGRYSPRTRFVEVYVVRGNEPVSEAHYHGLYLLEEKIKIGKHRVDISRLDADDLTPPDLTGGYLLKFDRPGPGERGIFLGGGGGGRGGGDWKVLLNVEPKEQTLNQPQRAAQRNYITAYLRDFQIALLGPNWKDPATGYRAWLDVDAAIDFHILEVLSGNVDTLVLSTHFYKPREGKITFGPHWDFDRSLGSTDQRNANPRDWNNGPAFTGGWWPRLLNDVDFWQQWADRWQELRQTHFSTTNLNALTDRLCAEIREAQPREVRRWNLQPRGGSYQAEIDLMKNWVSNRVDFIDQQFVPPPVLRRADGRLTLGIPPAAPPNTLLYYTLNGTDPRLPQGNISTNALVATNSLSLPATARVLARAYNAALFQYGGPPVTTHWSRPVKTEPPRQP